MKKELLKVSIRQNSLYLPEACIIGEVSNNINESTMAFISNCTKLGFTFSENLLHHLNGVSPTNKLKIFEVLKDITDINANWTPLVKQWNEPTNETRLDHFTTFLANALKLNNGTQMPCGHNIPENTFKLDKYNGCPFCGTPFEFEKLKYKPNLNKLKTLELWKKADIINYYKSLLESPVVLDATQIDSLKKLINNFGFINEIKIINKETLLIVIDTLVCENKITDALNLFNNVNDVLHFLWYKHTGFLQVVEPKTILKRTSNNAKNINIYLDQNTAVKINTANKLKLKFTRKECKQYAYWLNQLAKHPVKQCEIMHPKRGIWIRVIRALRLAEYAKHKEFKNLTELLDVFYNEKYTVWQGKVNHYKLKSDAENTFKLLKQRPSLFARSLFSTMLWFGKDVTIKHFKSVMFDVPPRLIYTLNMYADYYFVKNSYRVVKPLGGKNKIIPTNKLLELYSDNELKEMQNQIQQLTIELIKNRFLKHKNTNKTIYIHDFLFKVPLSIGDRSEMIQELPSEFIGTRFKVEGKTVRLFLQWGKDLPAQHLDMDLSCKVAYENKTEFCSYLNLVIDGCKHSGDIQYIPHKVGTAEYIDIDIDVLTNKGAKYVSFTCNAYSNGSLTPNLVVGWMNSKYPMHISKKGVAYNPTNVQHQIKISKTLTKALVFGVLDVEKREIIWLEMSFDGQIVQNLNVETINALLHKLETKIKIGDLLKLKAEVQNLKIVNSEEIADEIYNKTWCLSNEKVNQLFLD